MLAGFKDDHVYCHFATASGGHVIGSMATDVRRRPFSRVVTGEHLEIRKLRSTLSSISPPLESWSVAIASPVSSRTSSVYVMSSS